MALPCARFDLAEETSEAMGVSDGISEGERQKAKGTDRRAAPKAMFDNRVIILKPVLILKSQSQEFGGCWTRREAQRKPSGICTSTFFDWAKEPALRLSDSLLALIRVYNCYNLKCQGRSSAKAS